MNTLFSIQILRAIAACAVALAHIHGDLKYHMGVSLMPAFSVGGVGVDIFFVISGFIMVYVSAPMFGAAGGPRIFLLRRICRIAPLYWAATTLYIAIVLWALGRGSLPGFDWALASYLFVPYPGGNETFPVYSIGWTLNYEMFFYCVFAVVLIWPRRAAVAILAAAFVAWVGLGALVDLPAPMRFLSHAIVLEFVFGALLGLAFIEGIRLSRLVGRLMIAAAIAILAVQYAVDYLPLLITPIWPPRFVGLGIPALLVVGGAALQEPRPLEQSARDRPGKARRCVLRDLSAPSHGLHPGALRLASGARGGAVDRAGAVGRHHRGLDLRGAGVRHDARIVGPHSRALRAAGDDPPDASARRQAEGAGRTRGRIAVRPGARHDGGEMIRWSQPGLTGGDQSAQAGSGGTANERANE